MEFSKVKEFCKHAGPGVICPDNFKNCNADNCPLAIQSFIDDEECDRYCPVVDKYRSDARRAKPELIRTQEAHKNLLDQYDEVKAELEESIHKSLGLVNSTLYDLKDKLNTTLKRLEP